MASFGLLFICIYIAATIGYVFFADYFVEHEGASKYDTTTAYDSEMNTYCDTLANCLISTLYMGTRMGGGIGEALGKPFLTDSQYFARHLFDLVFFLVVVVYLLNIFLAIIVDTFAESRKKANDRDQRLKTICFICG